MRRITLVRHGHAVAHAAGGDFERPLDLRGRHEVERTAEAIVRGIGPPELILASAALRTRETAVVLRDAMLGLARRDSPLASAALPTAPAEPAIVFERSLYQADWPQLLEALQHADRSVAHLMLVGHNPGISELALRWSRHFPEHADFAGFGTAGWCSATFASVDLSGLSAPSAALFYRAPT